jgi:hypothetical protein
MGDAAARTGRRVEESAKSAAGSLRQISQDFVSEQKSKAADQLTAVSSALRSASEQLGEGQESSVAGYAEMAAQRLDEAARYLGDQDVAALMRDVERAARRRPELFLGGMFLLGLGISRFLKASRPDTDRASRSYGQA